MIKNILFIGFTVQICLGLFWMAGNFTKIQDFPSADTGVYPVFLQLAGKAYILIYLLQLGAALYAGYRLLVNLHIAEKGICLWGSLALMTLPMAMQCHMALLPYSFVCSLVLLEISFVCESGGKDAISCRKALAGSLACYAAQCLLWPKYCIPGAVLPLLLLFWKLPGMFRKKDFFRGLLFAAGFFAVLAAGCGAQQRREGDGGSISGWNWLLVKRVCWPTLWVDWGSTPEVLDSVSEDEIWRSAYYPSNLETHLKPAMEEAMTPEAADALMRKMVRFAWDRHSPMVVRQIGWDVLGYGVTPVILPLQLTGDAYDSCSVRNYEIMRNEMPTYSKYYVRTACSWFAVSLALMFAAALLSCIAEPVRIRDAILGAVPVLAVIFSAGMVILFFTMQGAGIMDYKYTVWINQLWIAGSIKIISGRKLGFR